ncbi:DUF4158 domain-containing protein [Streptosporangium sp. NPDC002544]|uniref:DUF4158 domain-containing protein n=1 Tax=Streptosporangium sp. NPDC002544 TaxID=3154538 RepID=UPI003331A0E5
MPVEFLSGQEAAAYGRYRASVSQADLELFFYLDDDDHTLMARAKPRGDHNRLGFGIQLTTARCIGRFLTDPLVGVPTEVVDFLRPRCRWKRCSTGWPKAAPGSGSGAGCCSASPCGILEST